ncbi:hypothetical protein KAU11_09110 [Candidatus Babeliales bacterium]|nr:hypothetical protein [Candidatus Babeliales bacterium]
MIGRTLDAMLSPLQMIGKECRKAGEDSSLLYLVDFMRALVLPVEKCEYGVKENGDEEIVLSENNSWNIYSPKAWKRKRECAKAFEQRRKVKVGGGFNLDGTVYPEFGKINKNFSFVERISDNTVTYRGCLISSNENELIENKNKGYTPVLYGLVIW